MHQLSAQSCILEGMRVFISSVKVSLEEERRALPGQIRALGHEPVMFEDFTAQADPSREACLRAVQSSDLVLLILGERYGYTFPETGQSATHDEFIEARRNGQTIYVFNKAIEAREEEQQAFVEAVGDYASGSFWKSFSDTADLLTQVTAAIREFESAPSPLTYEPLAAQRSVVWRGEWGSGQAWGGGSEPTFLETHVSPLDSAARSTREMHTLPDAIISKLRSYGAVSWSAAVEPLATDDDVTITVPVSDSQGSRRSSVPRHFAGVRVDKGGQVSAWTTLARADIGSVVTAEELTAAIGDQLRIVGTISVMSGERFAVSVGLGGSMMISTGTSSAVSFGFGGNEPVRIHPDESVSAAAFDVAADEVARGLAARLMRALTR